MENIKIRKMLEKDIDFIIYANKEVHEASNQTSEIIEFKSRLLNDVISKNPKAYVLVATYNNKPIGMALYSTVYFADEGQIMWVSNMFVEEEYRKKGIAKELMKYLIDICKKEDYYAICGAVDNFNERSKGFLNSLNCKWLENFKLFVLK